MRKWECQSCKGTYYDPQPDGRSYAHVCAAIVNPAFQPDPGRPDYDPRETIERPNRRDETLDDSLGADKAKIRAEGKGRRALQPLPWELETFPGRGPG